MESENRKGIEMSKEQVKRVGWWVLAIALLCWLLSLMGGCSGGKAVINQYDEAGNLVKRISIDPYVLARDFVNQGGELYVEVANDGTIIYWLVMGNHKSKVSPENARMIKEAINAVNPAKGILK